MTLTQEQRISVIKHAYENSRKVSSSQSVEDFISEIKSQEVLSEHGLVDAQLHDLEDEMSLFIYDPCAEDIDEEDDNFGISDEMKGLYS
jgi:hypothetical protein